VSATQVPDERRGRVLVVDDEPAIGRAIQRWLQTEHDVTAVTAARDALSRIAAGEPFDAILCDITMPEMTGGELHDELTRVAPEMAERMVFLTGGAFTKDSMEFLARVKNPRIDKPFRVADLRAAVRNLIR
jgi:CheY-like chemotaxis protein